MSENHPNMQVASILGQMGGQLGLDILRDDRQRDEFQKQSALATHLVMNTFRDMDDPTNPLSIKQALADAIVQGEKLGLPPTVSMGLFQSMGGIIDQAAQRSGVERRDFMDQLYKKMEFDMKAQSHTMKAQEHGMKLQKHEEEFTMTGVKRAAMRENIGVLTGKIGEIQAAWSELKAKYPDDEKDFAKRIDDLDDIVTTLKGVENWIAWNTVKDKEQLKATIVRNLMQDEDIKGMISPSELARVISNVIEDPSKNLQDEILKATGMADIVRESAPTADSIADEIIGGAM